MKAKYFQRYIFIIRILHRKPTFNEINNFIEDKLYDLGLEEVSYSKRTFQRDKNEIKQLFGIVINYDRTNKFYYIDENEISSSSQKLLNAFMLTNALNVYDDFSNNISFEEDNLGLPNVFNQLNDAIRNKQQIKIRYQKYYEDTLEERTIKPLALKEFRRRWYLVGYRKNKDNDIIRTYGLDRVLQIEILKKTFNNSDFNLNEYFKNFYGIIADKNTPFEEVVLAFDSFQGNYIKSLPLHHSQEIIKDTEDELIIKLKLHITFDFMQKLLSYGSDMKVLSPESLKNDIKNEFIEAFGNYE